MACKHCDVVGLSFGGAHTVHIMDLKVNAPVTCIVGFY